MAHSEAKPLVAASEKFKVMYERRSFLFFEWWVRVKQDSIGKDLVIDTVEDFDSVIYKGRVIFKK